MDRRARQKINAANASRQGRASFWTADRDAKLKSAAARGLSFREIAAEIGAGCTRGMVAGRSERIGVRVDGRERFRLQNRRRWIRWRIEQLQAQLEAIEAQRAA